MDSRNTKISKFLSFVLRHSPQSIGLTMDQEGWSAIDEIVQKSHLSGVTFDRDDLMAVITENDKKRFIVSKDLQKIRAAQGHSIEVNLNLPPKEPPEFLFHGTSQSSLASILRDGINSKTRTHVHLSSNSETAEIVGGRHGKPVLLKIEALQMHMQGIQFFLSENNVWLTKYIPTHYIHIIDI